MRRRFLLAFLVAVLLPVSLAHAEDLKSVLRKLDAAAANFHSTAADFKFDSVITDPIAENEVQTGSVYYDRNGKSFEMAAHIKAVDGRPVSKIYSDVGGEFKLFEGGALNQVTSFSGGNKFESYLKLGFGASGTELADKFDITYDGDETVDGVKTAKLELIAKDAGVRKNLPKVIVWMDTTRGISLKQYWDQGQGQSRTCTYWNIKVNQALPGDAFTFPTDKKTQFVKR